MYEHPFIVAKFTNESTLQTNLVRAHGGNIDFARNKVCLNGETMATCNRLAGNGCYWVSLATEVVIQAGHQMVVPGKILAGVLPGWSWMVDSLSKPPGGKCVMVGRSLVKGGRGKVSLEMFSPSDEDVLLWKNTHTTLVHPVEVEGISDNQNHQINEVSYSEGR